MTDLSDTPRGPADLATSQGSGSCVLGQAISRLTQDISGLDATDKLAKREALSYVVSPG